jgi:predicted ATPase/DNA-binding SARP family transcriptional activator
MALEFGVLGPFEVRSGEDRLPIGGARRRALLAYLLLHVGAPQTADRLIDAVWSDTGNPGSLATLRTYVSHFRKMFAVDPAVRIAHVPGGYLLDLPPEALDVARFSAAVSGATVEPDIGRRIALLQGACALWRGEPLDEFAGQMWADDAARRWTQVFIHAQELLAEALLEAGHHAVALDLLEPLVVAYPLHEQFWGQLVVARYRCGRQAEALAAGRDARRILAEELGIEPGPILVELERQVLDRDPALDAPRRVGDALSASAPATVVDPLPRGVVTFLLTDIEASTILWDEHPAEMAKALVRHEDVIRDIVDANEGRLLKSRGEGDATLSVFARATDAMRAAVALQRRLEREAWPPGLVLRTRVAVHTGEAQLRDGDYYGGTLNRAARMRSLAAGGEILLSRATHDVVVDALADEVVLVDIGNRPLKGLKRGERIYAAQGPGLAPSSGRHDPSRGAGGRAELVGRAEVVERVIDALMRPGVVTLCGPGGIGKTRLMHEICDRLPDDSEHFARTWTVDLVGARRATDVESAVYEPVASEVVGLAALARDEREDGLVDRYASSLGGRRGLLAIDNCEHVTDYLEPILAALAARCPTLSILATSRQPIGAQGERIVSLGPLEVPRPGAEASPDDLARVESVRLLLERVRDAGCDLDLSAATAAPVAELCRQLDGIPLALELAAARLRAMSPQDLVSRMHGRIDLLSAKRPDARHRTMHAAIEWSYNLLDHTEQTLLRRLSVFVGGFNLDAAETVCADPEPATLSAAGAVYLTLAELVAKSFVVFDPNRERYRLLEPIRFFAREQLDEAGERYAMAQRHADWVLRISRIVAAPHTLGASGVDDAFRAELDNVQAALAFCESEDHATHLRIVAALGYTWFESDWRRGRAAADVAIGFLDEASARLSAAVLFARGLIEQRHDYDSSKPWLTEAHTRYTDLGEPVGRAWAAFFLGRATRLHDERAARALLHEAMELFRSTHVSMGEVWCLLNLGGERVALGERQSADAYFEHALAILTPLGDTLMRGIVLGEMANNAFHQGDLDRARALYQEALAVEGRGGDDFNLVILLAHASLVELASGDLDTARAMATEGLARTLHSDDETGIRELLAIYAVVSLEAGDARTTRRLYAATGWDVDPPLWIVKVPTAPVARALGALEPLRAKYEQDARVGRAAGWFATARSIVADVPRPVS